MSDQADRPDAFARKFCKDQQKQTTINENPVAPGFSCILHAHDSKGEALRQILNRLFSYIRAYELVLHCKYDEEEEEEEERRRRKRKKKKKKKRGGLRVGNGIQRR